MDRPNIILIVADTMRRDAVGVYNPDVKTHNIDLLAKDSIVYSNAISPAPWTVPAHASLFTGKYTSEHGLHETYDIKTLQLMGKMNEVKYETIAEFLNKNGYNTVGLSANINIVPGSGFDRGFNTFIFKKNYYQLIMDDILNLKTGKKNTLLSTIKNYINKNGFSSIVDLYRLYKLSYNKNNGYPFDKGGYSIINEIKNMSLKVPFFIFINFMEMHDPYLNQSRFKKPQNEPDGIITFMDNRKNDLNKINKIKNAYFEQSTILDGYIGEIINFLKENKIYASTDIIFTSDHGQEINENYYGHGVFLSDDLINVPLIVKNGNHKVVDKYISTVKVFDIIKNIVYNNDNLTLDDTVFSESYGIHHDQALKFNNRKDKDIRRVAIFKDNYELIVNAQSGIEKFVYQNKNIDKDHNKNILNELLEEISIFNGINDFNVQV